jgi:hypothetical protein
MQNLHQKRRQVAAYSVLEAISSQLNGVLPFLVGRSGGGMPATICSAWNPN